MVDTAIARARSWSVTLGVLLIIVGIFAMIVPLFATLVLITVIGWMLVLAAIEQAVHAFQTRSEGGFLFKVLLAVLYAIVAVMLLRRPVSGAIAATAIIATLFVLDGIMEMVLALQLRHVSRRSGWLFAGGMLSLIFGGIILYSFPVSAVWTIGLLVGIRLVFKGIEHIASASSGAGSDVIRPGDLDRAA
jgi:uncharacterized membrane protein HdeD (DUF308 family)